MADQKITYFNNGNKYQQIESFGDSEKGCLAFKARSQNGLDVFVTIRKISLDSINAKCPITCKQIYTKHKCQHDVDIVDAFKTRAKYIIQNVKHTNLVRYLDVNYQISEDVFIVTLVQEYVEGASVNELYKQGILPNLAPIAERLLKTISYLHMMDPKITHGYINDRSIFLGKSAVYHVADYHLVPYLMYLQGKDPVHTTTDFYAVGSLIESKNKIVQYFAKDFVKKCFSAQSTYWDLLSHEFLSNAHIGEANTIYEGPFLNHFEIDPDKLGKGSGGTVVKAKHPNGQESYALKLIELPSASKGQYARVKREVEIISQINHDNVVKYITSWEQSVNVTELGLSQLESESESDSSYSDEGDALTRPNFKDMIVIQMELCDMDLRTAMPICKSQNKLIPQTWYGDIARGLAHLHKNDIIHRDLNPSNIFLDFHGRVKIGDFGLATTIVSISKQQTANSTDDKNRSSRTGYVGTSFYIAPELSGRASNSTYGKEADIYSLGMIFLEMQHPPFATHMERDKVLNSARDEDFPNFMDESENYLHQMIKDALSHETRARPTAESMDNHLKDEGFDEVLNL